MELNNDFELLNPKSHDFGYDYRLEPFRAKRQGRARSDRTNREILDSFD